MTDWFTKALNAWIKRSRRITWEQPHGKGTSGKNKMGDRFHIYDMSLGYGPEKRWAAAVIPPCPDHRGFCREHDEDVYHGPNRKEAEDACQQWSDEKYTVNERR